MRLGLPALLYMVFIHPFIVYVMLGHPHVPARPSFPELYLRYFTSGRVLSGNGPLWFALALLAFCLVLVVWRTTAIRDEHQRAEPPAAPSTAALIAFGAALAVTTFLIRTAQPIGTNILNFQLCFFPQYVAAFGAGVLAGKHRWLETLVISRRAQVAGWLGVVGGPLLLMLIVFLFGPVPEHGLNPYSGGWNRQAFGLAVWEQFTGVGIALGMLSCFQRRFNTSGALARWLSERAFAVYVLHPPVLVGLTFVVRPIVGNPFAGAALLTIAGLIASFSIADLAKRVPGVRAIL